MQTNKYIFLDSEYSNTNERRLRVVCFALVSDLGEEKYWIDGDSEEFKFAITRFISYGYTFVSFNVEAEASALLSLGIDPLKMKWIDLYLEYVMLSNHNNDVSKGEQYIDGNVKKLSNWGFEKGKKNLAAALFKLCKIKVDTEHKTKMRDLIISSPPSFTPQEQVDILDYCLEDTKHLPALLKAINDKFKVLIPKEHRGTYKEEAHWRAEYSVRTAMMVRVGYPINVEWTKNLSENIPILLRECCEDINSQFPDILPFRWNKKDLRYSKNEKNIKGWIASNHPRGWEKTKTGEYSLALDSWKKFYNYSHDYPRGNFGAQMVRYEAFSQQLKGFNQKAGGENKTFWDYVGSDGFVRPYMNIYGAQSSRSQPSSTSFLFLKTGWVRSLCVPPEGYAIGAIDFSSQEFLYGGLLAKDDKMIDAYRSGDVYLAYGKQVKMIPAEGTKESHGKERDGQKPVILGWQFWSTGYGLAITLNEMSQDKKYTEDEAQRLLDQLDLVYHKFSDFRNRTIDIYEAKGYIRLLDGFYMFGDNNKRRSVGNCPVQGSGGCVMRKAVQLAQDAGLTVIKTLHDCLYILFKSDDLKAMDTLRRCMLEASAYYFKGTDMEEDAKLIRVEGKIWSTDYPAKDDVIITNEGFKIERQKYFIDKRSKKQHTQFERFFKNNLNTDLL